jgi:putative DNA primase/helicase
LRYQFNNIPEELQKVPHWIVWRKEVRDGKPTKVPYQVNGEMAQSNNKRTWSTFYTAVHAYKNGTYDGIGFMFSKDDPYIGIDIDHCVTDEVPNAFAQEVIELLDSYTEFSPSGDGVHIIIKGTLPSYVLGTGKKSPKLGLEVYRYGRYFTFTGNRENDNEVFERTDEVHDLFYKFLKEEEPVKPKLAKGENRVTFLSNSELWEKMFSSRSGDGIRDLFNGELVNNDHSASDLALCNHLAFWTDKDGTKMDAMFRESALYRDKWDKVHHSNGETYGERTIAIAIAGTSTTIADGPEEQESYAITINKSKEDVFEQTKQKFMRTELGNAERIVSEYGNVIRHVDDVGWYVWDGKRWKADRRREIEKITSKVLRKLFKGNDDDRKWAKVCEKRSVRMNSIKDMIPMVPAEREEFDTHKFLFNCSNGVLDLKNGKLYPHDKDYMMTKLSNVDFDKNASCPNWTTFLESIFKCTDGSTDYEVIEFMQRAIGYSLTGDISEQVMFFLFGSGRNGKSTFLNVVQNLLGDYAKQTNSDTFIKKNNDSSINNDVARLFGSRFVSAVESEDGQKLSESLVKQITGGEKILARFLRQEFFEFEPEFKVFFTTNHKPIIHGIDEGIWRRVKLIPFTVTIPKESVDKNLPEKLTNEMPGILNWALDGCLKWQKDGLGNPTAIAEATNDYKENMDILEPFIFEKCFVNQLAKIEAKDLFKEYEKWCYEFGEIGLKNRAFYRMLEVKGYKRERGSGNKYFVHGIGLKDEKYKFLENPVTEQVVKVTENTQKVTGFQEKLPKVTSRKKL